MPGVEVEVNFISGLSTHEANSLTLNPDQRDFTEKTDVTPVDTLSYRTVWNIYHNKNDETRNYETTEVGKFPALRSVYDRQTHANHMVTDATPNTPIFLNVSGAGYQLNATHFHSNPGKHKLKRHTFHPSKLYEMPPRQISDTKDSFNWLAEAASGLLYQQRIRTSLKLFNPKATFILIFDGQKKKLKLFEELSQAMLNYKL